MKKILLISLSILTLACQEKEQQDQGYSVSGTTVGFNDGDVVYVNSLSSSNRPIILDSTVVKNNAFKVSLPVVEQKDFHYLTFNNQQGNLVFVAENNPINMTIYKDSLRASIVKGGKENKVFFDYTDKISKFNKKYQQLNKDYIVASRLKDSTKLPVLKQQQLDLKQQEKEYRMSIAKDNPDVLMSVIALSDIMTLKLYAAKDINDVFATLDPTIKNSRLGKVLATNITYSVGTIDVGSTASNFSAPTPEGTTLSLKEAMGEITIIDFWASWCRPCRAENPNVVRLYNKYHSKGLNIIGVSLDKNKDHWTKAIKDDQLGWSHISNLQYWQEPIAKAYGVRSIPATFILDKEGKVIAKNLRGAQLEAKIAELLGETS